MSRLGFGAEEFPHFHESEGVEFAVGEELLMDFFAAILGSFGGGGFEVGLLR